MEELEKRYRRADDGVSRSQWQIIWLLAQGQRSEEIHKSTGYSVKWIQVLARRYNTAGAAGIGDKRTGHSGRKAELKPSQQAQLKTILQEAQARNEYWTGPRVAAWISDQVGHPVHVQRGYEWLARLGFSPQIPRRQHVEAKLEDQAVFKKRFPLP
jgi:transposase